MAKFYGKVAFAITSETKPGVYKESIVARNYFGDMIRNSRRLESSDQVNDNINISNEISIVADPYAYENFHAIRYVEFMGAKWKVKTVDVQRPRLVLSLGGLYNGQ